jgi:hypothetical protein
MLWGVATSSRTPCGEGGLLAGYENLVFGMSERTINDEEGMPLLAAMA